MRPFITCILLGFGLALIAPPTYRASAQSTPPTQLHADALIAPPPSAAQLAANNDDARGPSQYLAGHVAVRLVLPESNGAREPSRADWSAAEIAQIRADVETALAWWENQLPLANLRFSLQIDVVPTAYEPATHGLVDEELWIGDTLGRLGFKNGNYFDQAYAATFALRDTFASDWATTIFVANSAGASSDYFADGYFAYAYINGPFMVLSSAVGAYSTEHRPAIIAHEFGHLFGALDQYAVAQVDCARRSGYLDAPTRNSQYQGCGTSQPSIMLEPINAYGRGAIDDSARRQVGYADDNHNGVIDPLDTHPILTIGTPAPLGADGRPHLHGHAQDIGFPAPRQATVSINNISTIEFRVPGGVWQPALPSDGAFDSTAEHFQIELPLYDGRHLVELRARNSAGASSAVLSTTLYVHGLGPEPTYRPSAPSLSATPNLSLDLSAPADTTTMQMSENSGFVGAAWHPYQSRAALRLSGEGAHTLYVRFRDGKGRTSRAYALPVLIDTTPPQGSARIATASQRLLMSGFDSGSGLEAVEVQIGEAAPVWMPYQQELVIESPAATVRVRLRDQAGNVSPVYQAAVDYATMLPQVVR